MKIKQNRPNLAKLTEYDIQNACTKAVEIKIGNVVVTADQASEFKRLVHISGSRSATIGYLLDNAIELRQGR